MDMGEVRVRNTGRISSSVKMKQAERIKGYQQALDSMAMAKEKYETVKMEATVKAFVEGSKSKVDIKKYMTEEARVVAMREREVRLHSKSERERRVCLLAVGFAVISVLLAMFFMMVHH